MSEKVLRCGVCPRTCRLLPGQTGACRARGRVGAGGVGPINYGQATSLALDSIEKKPLARYRPGTMVLSVGSYGCNLSCPFCQNHAIAQCGAGEVPAEHLPPERLVQMAKALIPQGNMGLAFTYNEPAVGWEYVCDAGVLAKKAGLDVVMVTNGCFAPAVLEELLGVVDAFNIDLKCFTEAGYQSLGGAVAPPGWLQTVQNNIATAAAHAYVEVSWLVVPGLSDDEAKLAEAAGWLAGVSPHLPLHLSRYFPRWKSTAPATPLPTMHRLYKVAKTRLENVFLGNM